ncbi:MAG TPA: glycosyltransferase [Acetobacteraceae bacterium]|jgi:GT2 family glycosyltransferase|nr:glycosyltransferase [Acetobacteraceae bacterium]
MSTRRLKDTGGSDAENACAQSEDALAAHRYRFVARLEAELRRRNEGAVPELVGELAARDAAARISELPELSGRVGDEGILALAATGDTTALRHALSQRFGAVVRYLQRPATGSIITDARFADARVIHLEDGGVRGTFVCELLVCGRSLLPLLPGGLFEAETDENPEIGDIAAVSEALSEIPRDAEHLVSPRADAARLIDRLIDVDAARLAERLESRRLAAALAALGEATLVTGDGGVDFPKPRHFWPLRDDRLLTIDMLEPYERRFDDEVVVVASSGELFRRRFRLDGDEPLFDEACIALNEAPKRLTLVPEGTSTKPQVSIIIPVYGELGYTLTCLDALFAQEAAATVEIIVIDDASPDSTAQFMPTVAGIRFIRQSHNGGFLRTCNAAARQARGEILVFLNNDTRVMPRWLDSLVESFTFFGKAGVVGSKLLYPDGRLQEAGGIVWRNGEAWNYGREDDPNRPQYCHARQVDYVSGASIAIPRKLWNELGGFDEYFAPAYYEDVDLAFRARAAGYEMWYQPASRAIHYEGRTSGTNTSAGAKAYQVANAAKFRLRYRDALLDHRPVGMAPFFERERQVRKRVLVMDATCPTPTTDAGSVYVLATMRLLKEFGYKVYFLPIDNFMFLPDGIVALQKIGIECGYNPYDSRADQYLARYGSLFDLVFVFRFGVLEHVLDAVRRCTPIAPVIVNTVDLHYLRVQRAADISGDPAMQNEAEAMKARELGILAKADCVMTPSSFEVDVLARELPAMPAIAMPLMTEVEGTEVGFAARRDVCFLGGFDHAPNVDAVKYFVAKILPTLKAAEPKLRFVIAGANPTAEVHALASEDVAVTGMVPDLRDVFDTVRVFVSPLRFGAGMKGKILSAMSYGVPVVTTSIGVEGFEAENGTHLLVADEPADFAAATLRIYRSRPLWRDLSRNGMQLVAERYSRTQGKRLLAAAIETAYQRMLGLQISADRQLEAAE